MAIIGWGSLLWHKRPNFDEHHERWQIDDLALPLEFSRYATSSDGVLKLAIDTVHGTSCAISKRDNPDDAIAVLRYCASLPPAVTMTQVLGTLCYHHSPPP
jgi:hypothetical protein